MRVSVNIIAYNSNSKMTCRAMAKGIAANGDEAVLRSEYDDDMSGFDAAVLWGYTTPCQRIIRNCETLGIPWLFMDLGYWRREKGYFKVVVNNRHPYYLLEQNYPDDRWRKLKLEIKPWKVNDSGAILVAGMSGKASWSWGLQTEEYERAVIAELQTRMPDRLIIYRPKPSWGSATKIPGSKYDRRTPLANLWPNLYCVVAHHSNVCCDALVEGIPVFSKYGAASLLGPHDLSFLPRLSMPDNRERWAANLAYSQWTTHEMSTGACWAHFKEAGFIK